jgi:hypothetical protein
VVWHKFARYWDIEMREVPMAPGRYMMDAASMLERVDENTIMVVPTLGVTYTGAYEPVEAMSQALDKLQADTGLDVDIHVDGASGGFLAPFCAPEVAFDFRLPRVKSISAGCRECDGPGGQTVNSAQTLSNNRSCSLQGMACVRSGQAVAWPLVSDRSVRRDSGVKHDFSCTFTRHLPLCSLPAINSRA